MCPCEDKSDIFESAIERIYEVNHDLMIILAFVDSENSNECMQQVNHDINNNLAFLKQKDSEEHKSGTDQPNPHKTWYIRIQNKRNINLVHITSLQHGQNKCLQY